MKFLLADGPVDLIVFLHLQYCLGPVARHKVEGDHMNFLTEEHVDTTAEVLNKVFA